MAHQRETFNTRHSLDISRALHLQLAAGTFFVHFHTKEEPKVKNLNRLLSDENCFFVARPMNDYTNTVTIPPAHFWILMNGEGAVRR